MSLSVGCGGGKNLNTMAGVRGWVFTWAGDEQKASQSGARDTKTRALVRMMSDVPGWRVIISPGRDTEHRVLNAIDS